MHYDAFPVGPLSANCILVWDADAKTGVVVDPGDEAAFIQDRVKRRGFQVTAILLTHAHFDHVGAAKELQDLWKVPTHLHPADADLAANLDLQTGIFGFPSVPTPVFTDLADDQEIHGLRVIHTPGHSPGCCCFLENSPTAPVLLAGDTLFHQGVGRTDLFGGNWETLRTSILEKLYVLDVNTRVIPGHGPETTIGQEAASNPFVQHVRGDR